jgi:hypothetical protein
MMKRQTIGILALSIVFTGVVLRYSFFQPYIPGAVRTAIPKESTFVYEAASLEELLESPVCAQLDASLGAGNTLKALLESSSWTRLVVPSDIAVADLPLRRTGQNRTWAAASWIGWRSPWLRWRLEHTRDPRLVLLGKHSVWPIWQYTDPDLARGMSLTFALTDNLFLACLSESPGDIVYLLEAYDMRDHS